MQSPGLGFRVEGLGGYFPRDVIREPLYEVPRDARPFHLVAIFKGNMQGGFLVVVDRVDGVASVHGEHAKERVATPRRRYQRA